MSVLADERSDPGPLLVFILYCVHLLPYLGSATNWVLYGLLNTQLQVRHDVNPATLTTPVHAAVVSGDNISMCNLNAHRDGLLASPDLQ